MSGLPTKVYKTIEECLDRDFSTWTDWLVENNVDVLLGKDKTKSFLFSPKHRSKKKGDKWYLLQGCQKQVPVERLKRSFHVPHLFNHTWNTDVQPGVQIWIRNLERSFRFYKTSLYFFAYNWATKSTSELNIVTPNRPKIQTISFPSAYKFFSWMCHSLTHPPTHRLTHSLTQNYVPTLLIRKIINCLLKEKK